jgi:hypothetical protein
MASSWSSSPGPSQCDKFLTWLCADSMTYSFGKLPWNWESTSFSKYNPIFNHLKIQLEVV